MPQAPPPRTAAQISPGLEQQLRKITAQIETLRAPGVTEAIKALREELAEIGRALTRRCRAALSTRSKTRFTGLARRIAEDRQAGTDAPARSPASSASSAKCATRCMD